MDITAQSRSIHPVRACREALTSARESGNSLRISSAMADLGLALFQNKGFEEGSRLFEDAARLAAEQGDIQHQASVLGKTALAHQLIGRLPDAYRAAEEMQSLGEENDNPGLICDALANQGQIQLDSGDPIAAMEKFQEAKALAQEHGDRLRLMNVHGAIGNCKLTVAAPEEALANFTNAKRLAAELGDRESEIGFEGNIGTVYSYWGNYHEAIASFELVLPYLVEKQNVEAQAQVLRHLIIAHRGLHHDDQVVELADRGIALGKGIDRETQLAFFELKSLALYRLQREDEARKALRQAIEIAKKLKDKTKQVDLLIGLGESFTVAEKYEQALHIYQEALDLSVSLGQQKNEAYLTGRLGVTLAELGDLDQAIEHHQHSLSMALERKLPGLQAEQRTMLAMAYLDKGEFEAARNHAEQALGGYQVEEQWEHVERTKALIAEIENRLAGDSGSPGQPRSD